MDLSQDLRWQRFNDSSQSCACCGKSFDGIFDIGYDHPEAWPHGNRSESGKDILVVGKDQLTADLCQWGPHRFIRCVLPIPIIGSDERFAFGPWGSVNPQNFDRYLEHEKAGTSGQFEGCFAWLMNTLPGFEFDEWLPCNLIPGAEGERPVLEVHDDSHELARLQEDGITFDQLLDIYEAAGQDVRPHLTAH